ncbi:MAG: aminotransferase class IV [Lutimonas sp.]
MTYINLNGTLEKSGSDKVQIQNRGFTYGDALFDVLKFEAGKLAFLEDHYFRLMSSMRMLRMRIPNHFTLEGYEKELFKTLEANEINGSARIRTSVFRAGGGFYSPESNQSEYRIEAGELPQAVDSSCEIELFKDYHVSSGLLSTVKTNNRMVNVLGSIFAQENDYQNAILINERKELVGATDSNLFLVKGEKIITPALDSGCINGIIRKKVIEQLKIKKGRLVEETAVSPFELLKVDEVFLTNSIIGIQSVDRYRKKSFQDSVAREVRSDLKL